jgi:ribonuclease HI
MSVPVPHFLLYSHAARPAGVLADRRAHAAESADRLGHWRFELRSNDGLTALEAEDRESCDSAERLELIAIVRGLESLDQPSRVTLFTSNRGIRSGLKYGLPQWRESDWQWERYGKLSPVKNGDLWQRIDRALAIHDVRCRECALEAADDLAEPLVVATAPAKRHRTTARGQKLRIDSGREIRGVRAASRPRTAWTDVARAWFSRLWRQPGRDRRRTD